MKGIGSIDYRFGRALSVDILEMGEYFQNKFIEKLVEYISGKRLMEQNQNRKNRLDAAKCFDNNPMDIL